MDSNPSRVDLEPCLLTLYLVPITRFNPTRVDLEQYKNGISNYAEERFNPTRVDLEPPLPRSSLGSVKLQPHESGSGTSGVRRCDVADPRFNPTRVDLEPAVAYHDRPCMTSLQPHEGGSGTFDYLLAEALATASTPRGWIWNHGQNGPHTH